MLLKNLKLADAEKVVKRIQDNLNNIEIDVGGGEKERMTVSIGIVGFGNGIEEEGSGEKENLGINKNSIYSVIEKNKQKITQLADKTMYFSKAQGRNRYTLFNEELDVLSPQGGYILLESGKVLSLNDLMENKEEEVTLLDFLKTRENNVREKEVLKETVESINLFEHMREEDLDELIPYFEKKEYKENEIVLEEGTYSGYIFILKSGLLEVRKEDMKLGEINNGEIFGENAFFYGIPHMADVTALTNSVVWAFPEKKFREFLENYPHIETRLWNVLKEREESNKQIMGN